MTGKAIAMAFSKLPSPLDWEFAPHTLIWSPNHTGVPADAPEPTRFVSSEVLDLRKKGVVDAPGRIRTADHLVRRQRPYCE